MPRMTVARRWAMAASATATERRMSSISSSDLIDRAVSIANWARTHSEASLLQGEEAGGVEAIDADRFTVNAQLLEEFDDLGGDRCGAGRASRADVRPASFLLSALPWRNGLQDRPVRAGTPTGRVCPEQGPRRICPSRVTTTRS